MPPPPFLLLHSLLLFLSFQRCPGLGSIVESEPPPNILFIIADDLRAELPWYPQRDYVVAPNLAALAARSVSFAHAYNQVPVCFPSRHSLLTGLRPDTLSLHTWTDAQHPYVDSLFSMLVRHGYRSSGVGKLFHHPHNSSSEFTDGRWDGGWYKYQNIEGRYMRYTVTVEEQWADEQFRDHMMATHAIEKLRLLSRSSVSSEKARKPWILSVGFKLPHTQYHIPAHSYQLYDKRGPFQRAVLDTPLTENGFPQNTSRVNYRCCATELFRSKADAPVRFYGAMRIANTHRLELLTGYLGGVSFLDSQVGRLLDELKELRLTEKTIVVFTSDHGMHVGEKGMWEKYTLFEETTKVPLLISDPRYPANWGKSFPLPVELVDIIPTVLDLVGIKRMPVLCPKSKLCVDLEGKSLAAHIRTSPVSSSGIHTSHRGNDQMQYFAVSQMRRCRYGRSEKHQSNHPDDIWSAICGKKNRKRGSVMGYSLRTAVGRYTAWLPYDERNMRPKAFIATGTVSDASLIAALETEEYYAHTGEIVSTGEAAAVDGLFSETRNMVYDAEVQAAVAEHRKMLYRFLRERMNFNFSEALQRTSQRWQEYFHVDSKGRAVDSKVLHPLPSVSDVYKQHQ